MPNIIDSIQISSSTFDVRDKSATTVVNLTQEQYDNLPSSAKTANVLYNITDATAGDLSQYWTSAQTQSAITQATSGLQETLSAGTGIDITDNVISATGGGGGITSGEVQSMIDDSISGKADTTAVTQDIAAAVSGKLDTSTFETYSGNVETALSGKQDTLSAGTGIQISGNVISATGGSSSGGTEVVEMTQAEYDAAASAGTLDAETLYIITDAEEINANEYVTKASNVSSGLTVADERTGTYNYLQNVKEVYISADTNCSMVNVYFSSNYFGISLDFDFQTTPSFGHDYMVVDFDSENRTYHVWSTDTDLIFYNVYSQYCTGSETFKLWVYTWQIPSGQTATVLNEAIPQLANAVDTIKVNALKSISINTDTNNKTMWNYGGDTLNGNHYGDYGIIVCDGKGIVNKQGLKLGDIETENIYSKEILNTSSCTQTPFGSNNSQENHVNTFIIKFNYNVSDWNQTGNIYGTTFYYYYNDGNNNIYSGLLYIYVRNNGGTFEISTDSNNWSSDYTSITNYIQTNHNGLNMSISSSGISYTKATSETVWISYVFFDGFCIFYGTDPNQPFSSVTEYNNSFGIYEAVETLFGNYEDGKYIESSAVTSAVTSGSTDDEIPTAKAVYDALGGGGGITSGEVQTMINESISGKADTSSLATVATSGSYNDLTNKPTIPTVPTSNTAFTNDAGYLVANDISGKTDTSAFTAHTADTTVHTTSAEKTSWNGAVTALGGLKLVKLTQAQYDALATKDSNTLYVIVN